jgi:hypothetical protein
MIQLVGPESRQARSPGPRPLGFNVSRVAPGIGRALALARHDNR